MSVTKYERLFFDGQVKTPETSVTQYLDGANRDEGHTIERHTEGGSDDYVVTHEAWMGVEIVIPAANGVVRFAHRIGKGAKK